MNAIFDLQELELDSEAYSQQLIVQLLLTIKYISV